jgi:hypothetical protein
MCCLAVQTSLLVPMGNLAATLEMIGSIQLLRNNYEEVATTLERLCPLLELLPGAGRTASKNVSTSASPLASCFQLLKEVYRKIIYRAGASDQKSIGNEDDNNKPTTSNPINTPSNAKSNRKDASSLDLDNIFSNKIFEDNHLKMREKVRIMEEYLLSRSDLDGRLDRAEESKASSKKKSGKSASRDHVSPMPPDLTSPRREPSVAQKAPEIEKLGTKFFEDWVKSVNKNANFAGYRERKNVLATLAEDKALNRLNHMVQDLKNLYTDHQNQMRRMFKSDLSESRDDSLNESDDGSFLETLDNYAVEVWDLDDNSLMPLSSEDITEIDLLSSFYPSTGIIEDLEVILVSFVSTSSEDIQTLILRKLEWYCNDFRQALRNAPSKTQSIFAEDFGLAKAYLEVLRQIIDEGYGFVHEELFASGISVEMVEEYNELMRVREAIVLSLQGYKSINIEQLRNAYGAYLNGGLFQSLSEMNGLVRISCVVASLRDR